MIITCSYLLPIKRYWPHIKVLVYTWNKYLHILGRQNQKCFLPYKYMKFHSSYKTFHIFREQKDIICLCITLKEMQFSFFKDEKLFPEMHVIICSSDKWTLSEIIWKYLHTVAPVCFLPHQITLFLLLLLFKPQLKQTVFDRNAFLQSCFVCLQFPRWTLF